MRPGLPVIAVHVSRATCKDQVIAIALPDSDLFLDGEPLPAILQDARAEVPSIYRDRTNERSSQVALEWRSPKSPIYCYFQKIALNQGWPTVSQRSLWHLTSGNTSSR